MTGLSVDSQPFRSPKPETEFEPNDRHRQAPPWNLKFNEQIFFVSHFGKNNS